MNLNLTKDQYQTIAFLTIITISFIGATTLKLNDTRILEEKGQEVIDCRNQSFTCETTKINEKPKNCNEWHPWDDYKKLDCSMTQSNISEISYIADANNYINNKRVSDPPKVIRTVETRKSVWDLEFLPNGNMIWTNVRGSIYVRKKGENTVVGKVDSIRSGANGLMGLAVDPNFEDNNRIYAFYTYTETNKTGNLTGYTLLKQRISSFELNNGKISDEKVLVEVPGDKYHSGGRLEFGPDNKLYASVGEANMGHQALNNSFLGGKILRINKDGSVPESNPYNNYVFSKGHRNPQGLAFHPDSNTLYNTEHGDWRSDEINKVRLGGNYGWPSNNCEGELMEDESIDVSEDQVNSPVHCFRDWTLAPSGATFIHDEDSQYYGDLLVAGLRGKQLFKLDTGAEGSNRGKVFYISNDEPEVSLRLRDVEYKEGNIYALGNGGGIAELGLS